MRAYELVAGSHSIDGLCRCDRPDPKPLAESGKHFGKVVLSI